MTAPVLSVRIGTEDISAARTQVAGTIAVGFEFSEKNPCSSRKPDLTGNENWTMLLCDHLCRLIGWMVSDLVRSRATLEAEIWTLLQK
jgi:hypothetical protein